MSEAAEWSREMAVHCQVSAGHVGSADLPAKSVRC